jgi:hypothetical protein
LTIYRVRMMHEPNNKHGQANGRAIDESQIEIDFTIEILEQLGRKQGLCYGEQFFYE